MPLLATQPNYNFPIAITAGNPESIAPLILIKAWLALRNNPNLCFFTVNNNAHLINIAKQFNLPLKTIVIKHPTEATAAFRHALPVIDLPLYKEVELGTPILENVPFILNSLEQCVNFALLNKEVKALVTLPIDKHALTEGGFNFIGHTEYLASKSNIPLPVMMLATNNSNLKVVPIKTHLSLKESISSLTSDDIINTVKVCNNSFINLFNIKKPKFVILGLNPHAGEQGLMGSEEIDIINPAITHLTNMGIDVFGAIPADTAFSPKIINGYDAIIGMYHDQVLAPFKALAFNDGVNCTLGLPFIRTSPDHGTAFNIAHTNDANESSTIAAILLANKLQESPL